MEESLVRDAVRTSVTGRMRKGPSMMVRCRSWSLADDVFQRLGN